MCRECMDYSEQVFNMHIEFDNMCYIFVPQKHMCAVHKYKVIDVYALCRAMKRRVRERKKEKTSTNNLRTCKCMMMMMSNVNIY